MPSKIRLLTEHTINQIAAGEVIENPASVVKELVENSIDAGSTQICVEIKGGGRQLIRITDNGSGMGADDALLCLERHATSKIKEVDDIHDINTMGFRGEAIPSIASISKFTLLTRTWEENMGTMVLVDGGRLIQCVPAACSPGTTIEVKSLFFNVPVRKKFQKSPNYDTTEILKMLSTLALGHPTIKFELISNQETLFSAPISQGTTFLEKLGHRISVILGKDFFTETCPLEGIKGDYHIHGYIGLPAFTRQNRTGQHLFINQRGVINPLISYSVRDGYGTTLSTNRHPVYVLHVTLPRTVVDVNVHPQKKEVRLRQEQTLKELIIQSVDTALQNSGVSFTPEVTTVPFNFTDSFKIQPSFTFAPLIEEETTSYAAPSVPNPQFKEKKHEEPSLFVRPPSQQSIKVIATFPHYFMIETNGIPLFKLSTPLAFALVDQKAAHSRIIFERLLKSQDIETQTLLIPHTFETTPLEASIILEEIPFLNKMGLHIHQSGPNAFIIDAIPQIFGNTDIHQLLTDMIHNLRDYQDHQLIQKEREKQLAISASRSAVSQNKRLSSDEAFVMINQLMQCEQPYQCPQGKATIAAVGFEDLKKYF